MVARFLANGTPDGSFGNGGFAVLPVTGDAQAMGRVASAQLSA